MTDNIRYIIGSTVNSFKEVLLSSPVFPLTRAVPFGKSAWYDVQRILGTRHVDVIFDVGANIGQTTRVLCKYFRESKVYCFEPASEPYVALATLTRAWPNVTASRLALGREAGAAEMFVASGSESEQNTFVVDRERRIKFTGREIVQVETVDRFCKVHNIERIDILKADVQGWEINLLEGASGIIGKENVNFLFLEVSFMPESRDMVPFIEIHPYVTDRGFVLSGMYDFFRWGNKSEIYFANALYVHRRLAK